MRTTNRLFCESPLTHPTAVPVCVCVPGASGFGELVMDGLYLVLTSNAYIICQHLSCELLGLCLQTHVFVLLWARPMVLETHDFCFTMRDTYYQQLVKTSKDRELNQSTV